MIRITFAVPADLTTQANALMSCLGESEADALTFDDTGWGGYAVASSMFPDDWATTATATLTAPAWTVDIEAAQAAQAVLSVVEMPETVDEEGNAVTVAALASATAIVGVVGDDPAAALSALGVSRAE